MTVGVEVKRVDAPRRTRSMAVAVNDLRLDALYVVYPGEARYVIDDRITAIPAGVTFPVTDAGAAMVYPAVPRQGEQEWGGSELMTDSVRTHGL